MYAWWLIYRDGSGSWNESFYVHRYSRSIGSDNYHAHSSFKAYTVKTKYIVSCVAASDAQ